MLRAMPSRPPLPLAAALLLLMAGTAAAQGLYRQVDAQGRVSYTDQPPTATTAPVAGGAARGPAGGAPGASGALPYALRQIVQRYPVVLYAREDCEPCSAGRNLLRTRGIPFDERTVETPRDVAALERLSGQNALPLLTVGSQQLKGFADAEWTQYLDAAGYAPSVQLPPGYQHPPARPLVAAAPAAAPQPTAEAPGTAPASTPRPAPTAPANPAGIRF